MKRISDEELDNKIRLANERLNKLQEKKDARLQARRNHIAIYLEKTYNVTTIKELEALLQRTQNSEY